MSVFRSAAFWWLSLSFFLIVVVAGAPLISAFIAGGIANALGCTLNEGGVSPCPFMGTDIGEMLVVMFVLGWLAFVTLPFGAMALAVWLAAVCVVAFIAWRRRRRQQQA